MRKLALIIILVVLNEFCGRMQCRALYVPHSFPDSQLSSSRIIRIALLLLPPSEAPAPDQALLSGRAARAH